MSITTRRGDDGTTDLLFARRAGKAGPVVGALGAVDELNAALGLARVEADPGTGAHIARVQDALVAAMGELATLPADLGRYRESGMRHLEDGDLALIEGAIAEGEDGLAVPEGGWAQPGAEGSRAAAALDFARTVCRRAEREVFALGSGDDAYRHIAVYLNRLSDLLWILARREPVRG